MEPEMERLLERYWEGKTSLEEEKQVKAYFARQNAHSPEARYFAGIAEKQQRKYDGRSGGFQTWMNAHWRKVAAAVAILLIPAVLYLTRWNREQAANQYAYEIQDPEKAFEITKNALMLVSSKINEARPYTEKIKKINKAQPYTSQINKINEVEKTLNQKL